MTKPIDTSILRLKAEQASYIDPLILRNDLNAAADEIERLRAELGKYQTLFAKLDERANAGYSLTISTEGVLWSAFSTHYGYTKGYEPYADVRDAMRGLLKGELGLDIRFEGMIDGDIPMIEENARLRVKNERMHTLLQTSSSAMKYMTSLYENDLQCYGWHMNGESEPLNNFLEESGIHEANEVVAEFLKDGADDDR